MSPYYQTLRRVVGHQLLLMPAVAAVIHDEAGRLLLQQKHDGSWSLPAGAIEPGETPEQAVAREVAEETGFKCESSVLICPLGGPAFRHTYPNGDAVEYLILLYRCKAKATGSGPLDTTETRGIRFFAKEEMPELALPYDLGLLYGEIPPAP